MCKQPPPLGRRTPCRSAKRSSARRGPPRRAAALLMALFVMSVTSATVIAMIDTEVIQYAVLRNTIDYDRARYLAEAGIQHAMAELEQDITWRDGIPDTEFPPGSGNTYSATAVDGPEGTVIVTSRGVAGRFTRNLQIAVKHGG